MINLQQVISGEISADQWRTGSIMDRAHTFIVPSAVIRANPRHVTPTCDRDTWDPCWGSIFGPLSEAPSPRVSNPGPQRGRSPVFSQTRSDRQNRVTTVQGTEFWGQVLTNWGQNLIRVLQRGSERSMPPPPRSVCVYVLKVILYLDWALTPLTLHS